MTTKRRKPASKSKAPIPRHVRALEATRRLTKALLDDLKGKGTKRRRKPTGGPAGTAKPNPWPKCPGCFHRVPMLCDYCHRGRASVTENHTQACCPGVCARCARCRIACPGPCKNGQHCNDRCPGHDKEGNDQ